MVELIIAVSTVVIVSAACSLLEAILYSVPISHIESLAQAGRASGRILRRLREDVDRPIAAILSLNTIANTAGAAVAGAAAVGVFGHHWLAYFSAALTLVILLFSEIIPKTTGVVYNRPLASIIAWPLQILVWAMAPLVWLSRQVTRLIARNRTPETVSPQELITLTRLGGKAGSIHADNVEVITNVLSLEDRTVQDVMTPRTVVFSLNGHATVQDIRSQVGDWSYSRIPVYDKDADDIVGMVYRRNVLAAVAEDRFNVTLLSLMRPVRFVAHTLPLNRLLRMFLKHRKHMFIVIGEFGGFTGLVTLEDVLEEILGQEIVDEFDQVVDMRELAHRRREEILKGQGNAS